MLALRFQDKKEMYMLSTMHKVDTVNVRRRNRREDNIIQSRKLLMITTKKWEELTKMMQLLVIIHAYVKAPSGISRFFFII